MHRPKCFEQLKSTECQACNFGNFGYHVINLKHTFTGIVVRLSKVRLCHYRTWLCKQIKRDIFSHNILYYLFIMYAMS